MTTHEKAVQLQAALSLVNALTLKERASLTRQLFRSLGIKHVSVTVATGANCFYVVLRLPDMNHGRGSNSHNVQSCEACKYLNRAKLALEEILQRAFPKEVDNSDPQSDYFDYPWSFHFYT